MFHKISRNIETVFKRYQLIFFFIFSGLLAYVFISSLPFAMEYSQDMQWYPSKLMWEGTNPYVHYLENPNNWFLNQEPNYAHLLYFILYPLTLFSWESAKLLWAVLSMSAFIGTLIIFHIQKTPSYLLFFLTTFLIFGYTFSNTIANGQIVTFIAFFVSCAWHFRKKYPFISSICLALALVKYSFGLPILLGFFLSGYYRVTSLAASVHLAAMIYFSSLFDLALIETIFLPIEVAMTATNIGPIDVFSLGKILELKQIIEFNIAFIIVPVIFISFSLIIMINRNLFLDSEIIALSIILSLVTFFHLGYDQLMLLVGLFILKIDQKLTNKFFLVLSVISIFLWHGPRISNFLALESNWSMQMNIEFTFLVSFFLLSFVAFYIVNKLNFLKPVTQIED